MFRLRLIPDSRRSTHPTASASRSGRALLIGTLALLAVVGMVGWLLGRQGAHSGDLTQDTGPVLVAMRKVGRLHTASYTMKDVVRQESEQKPEGWVQELPGADSIAHWTTHNQALVVAEGTVEAGVDLEHLTEKDVRRTLRPDGSQVLQVHLPPVEIYPPTIKVQVEQNQAGLFWRDENIVPKAQEQAGQRFQEAAERENIRTKARTNAVETLQNMLHALGYKDVEFTF